MRLRFLLKSHYYVPCSLICAYGLFAATNPPTPTEAGAGDIESAQVAVPGSASLELAEDFREPDLSVPGTQDLR